jgi:hypothetical protein
MNPNDNAATDATADQYEAGDTLYAPELDELTEHFSADADRFGNIRNALYETASGQFIHVTGRPGESVKHDEHGFVMASRVKQVGGYVETVLKGVEGQDGCCAEFLIGDWPCYDARWSGTTVSVSTILDGWDDLDLDSLRAADEFDITFEVSLVSDDDDSEDKEDEPKLMTDGGLDLAEDASTGNDFEHYDCLYDEVSALVHSGDHIPANAMSSCDPRFKDDDAFLPVVVQVFRTEEAATDGLDYLVKALRDSPAEYDNVEVTTAGGFWSGDHYHEQKWYVRFEVSPEKDSDEEDEPKLMTDGGVDTDDPVPDEVQETAEEQNRVIAALDDADLVHDVPTGVALSAAQSGYEDEEANDALPVGMYAYQTMMDTLTILYSPPAAKAQAWSGNYACVWEAFEDANDEPKFVTVDGPEKGRTIREYVRKTYPDHVGDWTFQHNNAEDELFVVYQTDEAEMYLVDDGCGDPYRVMLYEDSWGEAPAVELAVFPSEGEAWSYMKDRMDEGEDQR